MILSIGKYRIFNNRKSLAISKITRAIITALIISIIPSCSFFDRQTDAQLLTDIPQMAIYAEAFNTSQTRYKINVVYQDHVAEALIKAKKKPALTVSRYLKSSSISSVFTSLDHLFSDLVINPSSFYPCLLELGNKDGRQILLPVSFNMPLIIFDKKLDTSMQDGFVLDIAELKSTSANFNKQGKGLFVNMGFGPRWSSDFLYSIVDLFDANFTEGNPLKWSRSALDAAIANIRSWSNTVNSSIGKEDDFQFKYLYLPMYKSVADGRIKYAYMKSSDFFVVSEERRSSLAFRWLAKNKQIPIENGIVFTGICRAGAGRQAAEAFLKWFYLESTQKAILDDAIKYRSIETSFGIAGGFSSVKTINEKVFPLYYPSLFGKLPPSAYLKCPNPLPPTWGDIKKSVVLPFLLDATGINGFDNPSEVLATRLQAWQKRHSSN